MKYVIICLMLLAAAGEVVAQSLGVRDGGHSWSVRVTSGYEQENFAWSIAGNSAGQDPNILSELKWRNVGGISGRVDMEGVVWRRWRVFASGKRVWTRWGSMTDTDYGLDNRNDQLYFLGLPVSGGYSDDATGGIGYGVLDRRNWGVVVYGGYGWNEQDFVINGGGYAQLNSRYDANWMGPVIRVVATWAPAKRWEVSADGCYNQVVYRAIADWNLIPEFSHPVSFRHHADGYGVKGELDVRYSAAARVGVLVSADWFYWETGTGIDALYLQSGKQEQTQLNSARRDGWGVRVGVDWRL